MKFLHLSDLHLGLRLCECAMLDDQAAMLDQLFLLLRDSGADAVLLAGDLYDRAVPPAEAVELLDDFLTRVAQTGKPVLAISGNHDSAGRVAFGAQLMQRSGVYVSPVYRGAIAPVTLEDEYGPVDVWLLPFLRPAAVRPFFPDAELCSYDAAVRAAVGALPLNSARRSVLVAHQFVTGAVRCDSEEVSVGGVDNVSAEAFAPFDYVALGHLHSPQTVGRPTVRYCGTPLKYSFSEAAQQKSATLVTLGAPGTVQVETVPLTPKHDLRRICGSYAELTARLFYAGTAVDDYLRATLTDENDIPDAAARLRTIYPNLLQLDYDNTRTRADKLWTPEAEPEQKTPQALFETFFEQQNGQPMTPAQQAYVQRLFAALTEEER